VPAYVKSLNGLHAGLFNPNGRGYPDISAQGLYFECKDFLSNLPVQPRPNLKMQSSNKPICSCLEW